MSSLACSKLGFESRTLTAWLQVATRERLFCAQLMRREQVLAAVVLQLAARREELGRVLQVWGRGVEQRDRFAIQILARCGLERCELDHHARSRPALAATDVTSQPRDVEAQKVGGERLEP